MTQNLPLDDNDPVDETFFDSIQELLSGALINFIPSVAVYQDTGLLCSAGPGDLQVGISIAGQYRWRDYPYYVAHPGGPAAFFDVYAVSKANATGKGAPADGDSDFQLVIVPANAAPTGVAISRFTHRGYWNGAKITSLLAKHAPKAAGFAGGVLSGEYPNPGFAQPMATADALAAHAAAASHTNARTPTGPAGGVLAGTYPNPGFAQLMATQAALNDGLAGLLNRFRWGLVDSDGSVIAGSGGFAVTPSAQYRTLTMTGGWPGVNPLVAVANVAAASLADLAKARNATANTVQIWTQDETGSPITSAFTFIAFAT